MAMWVFWPVLAPLDYDRAAAPWVTMQLAYLAWTCGLYVAVGETKSDWPFGRKDIDLLPESARYSQTSPLGINGVGQTLSLLVVLSASALLVPVATYIDRAVLRWRLERSKQQLRNSARGAQHQRDAITQAVRDSVPPFAQECMEVGVAAFQSTPVVIAANIVLPATVARLRGETVEPR